VVVDKDKD
jgi:hypothetical protein